jgi:hypothetical protein
MTAEQADDLLRPARRDRSQPWAIIALAIDVSSSRSVPGSRADPEASVLVAASSAASLQDLLDALAKQRDTASIRQPP